MSFFKFLKPDPFVPPIQNSKQIESKYKYWRIRIFYSMFIGYAFYYFTRNTFQCVMPGMITELGFTKAQLGYLSTTIFSLVYGLSKFASGILSDRSNPRYIMSVGLIFTGVCNILFGLSSTVVMFALLWGLNAWFQGLGWPPCARLLTHWYSQNERGSWWSSWNVSHNLGGILIPIIVAFFFKFFGWRYAMYLPGIICIGAGFYLMNRLRDTPQSLGLPPIEDFRDDFTGVSRKKGEVEKELSTREILFEYVLKNKLIWMLAVAYFCVYVVRSAVNTWSILFLMENRGHSHLMSSWGYSLFELGGFCGSLSAGWASDYLFRARRGPINALFSAGMFGSVLLLWFLPNGFIFADYGLLFLIGFFLFGPQMLIGVAAAELSHKKAVATATGFIGWIAYIGSAVAGGPLGQVVDTWGWQGFFVLVTLSSFLATVILFPLWSAHPKSRKEEKEPVPEPGVPSAEQGQPDQPTKPPAEPALEL